MCATSVQAISTSSDLKDSFNESALASVLDLKDEWTTSVISRTISSSMKHPLKFYLIKCQGQSSCCSPKFEAYQQSSPHELHWSSGVPSQSLSRTLRGQSHKIKKNSQIHNFHESSNNSNINSLFLKFSEESQAPIYLSVSIPNNPLIVLHI